MKNIQIGEIYKSRNLLTPDDGARIGLEIHAATIGDIKCVHPVKKTAWEAKELER